MVRGVAICALLLLVVLAVVAAEPRDGSKRHRRRWRISTDLDDPNNKGHTRRHRKSKSSSILDSFFTGSIGSGKRRSRARPTETKNEDRSIVMDLDSMKESTTFSPSTSRQSTTSAYSSTAQQGFTALPGSRSTTHDSYTSSGSTARLSTTTESYGGTSDQEVEQHNTLKSTSPRPSNTQNACDNHECGAGKECELDESGQPSCVCMKSCYEPDPREKVCSSHNITFLSPCHLYREKCHCEEDSPLCSDMRNADVHLEYNGECKELPSCPEAELVDFPRRMREWLFNVMKDYSERNELDQHYVEMEKEAETSEKSWVNAVLWKFCDLDLNPSDRHISRHELIALKAPIIPMEKCIIPFLDSCDTDGDHRIVLSEWGNCLGLLEDERRNICVPSSWQQAISRKAQYYYF